MTMKRAPRIKRILARLTGRPRSVEPSIEQIMKVEIRTLLERDCYEEAIFRLETSPDHMAQLVELLRERDIELPGVATLFRLAKAGKDISKAVDALSVRLLCNDLNISAYSSRALTHHYMNRGNLEEVDILLSSGVSSVQYGCAEGLRDACLDNRLIAIRFISEALHTTLPDVRESVLWALRTTAEMGSEEVQKTLKDVLSGHLVKLKGTETVDLELFRRFSGIHQLMAEKE